MRRPEVSEPERTEAGDVAFPFRSRDRARARDRRWSAGRRRPHTNGGGGLTSLPAGPIARLRQSGSRKLAGASRRSIASLRRGKEKGNGESGALKIKASAQRSVG